jgi:tetratricopeptide (TPR) repeat protein
MGFFFRVNACAPSSGRERRCKLRRADVESGRKPFVPARRPRSRSPMFARAFRTSLTVLALPCIVACTRVEAPRLRLEPVRLDNVRAIDPEVLELVERHVANVTRAPDNARAHGSLGLVYEANELWEPAEQSFANAAQLEPSQPLWRYHRALALLEAGRVAESNVLLAAACAELPFEPGVQLRLGFLRLDEGNPKAAEAAIRSAMSSYPNLPELLCAMALVKIELGDFAAAAELAHRAASADPSYGNAHFALGTALRALGKPDEARDHLTQGMGSQRRFLSDPLSAELKSYVVSYVTRSNEAQRLLDQGQAAQAVAIWQRIVDKRPGDVQMLTNLGAAKLAVGDVAGAIEVLNRALALDANQFGTHLNLADAYLLQPDMAKARVHADHAVRLGDGIGRAHATRARVLAINHELQGAYAELKRAVALDARNARFYVGLSEVCMQLHNFEEALEACRTAAELDPTNLPARFNLVLLTLRKGDVDEADRMLLQLEALAPDHPQLAKLRDMLRKVGR